MLESLICISSHGCCEAEMLNIFMYHFINKEELNKQQQEHGKLQLRFSNFPLFLWGSTTLEI